MQASLRCRGYWLLPFFAAALLLAACTTVEPGASGGALPRQLQSTGEGRVSAAPDLAILNLGVSLLRPSVREAQAAATATMSRVLDALRANDIAEADITTTGFSIYPEYTYSPEGQQSISGNRVNNNVSVKVRKIDSVGEVLDDAITSGGNDTIVNGVSFTIENTEPLVDQARDLAAADARRRADQLAGELGVRIDRVLSVAEFGGAPPPPEPFGRGGGFVQEAAALAPTPVGGGQVEVTMAVIITYAID